MTDSEFKFLLERYANLDRDEFERLCLQVTEKPDSMTEAARLALIEAARGRGTTLSEAAKRGLSERIKDLQLARALADQKQAEKDRALRQEETVLGYLGLTAGVVTLVLGLNAGHMGGSIAGAATVACSLWMVYSKRKN